MGANDPKPSPQQAKLVIGQQKKAATDTQVKT
jgi:hypothetical protein